MYFSAKYLASLCLTVLQTSTYLIKNNRDTVLKRLPAGGYHVSNRCIIEAIPFCTSMPEQQPLE